jgi:hypothetical protein
MDIALTVLATYCTYKQEYIIMSLRFAVKMNKCRKRELIMAISIHTGCTNIRELQFAQLLIGFWKFLYSFPVTLIKTLTRWSL